ncbi:MAG TPA: GLPGLI family protein [Moheibacter sp.]|nr:GLPGLI family protein [Moheibacter sp.]
MDKNDKEISEWRMIINAKGEIVKKNNSPFFHKKNKFYFFDKTLSRRIHVTDEPEITWDLSNKNETKNILGFTCYPAKATFRGRDYIAYYTQEIPGANGPWKFNNLPGLVLSVESKDGSYSFQTTEINLEKSEDVQSNLNDYIEQYSFIDWGKYLQIYNEDIEAFILEEFCDCETDGLNTIKVSKIEIMNEALNVHGINY